MGNAGICCHQDAPKSPDAVPESAENGSPPLPSPQTKSWIEPSAKLTPSSSRSGALTVSTGRVPAPATGPPLSPAQLIKEHRTAHPLSSLLGTPPNNRLPSMGSDLPATHGDDAEESDEECAWSPGSSTGRQGTDLMKAKSARQALARKAFGAPHCAPGPFSPGLPFSPTYAQSATHVPYASTSLPFSPTYEQHAQSSQEIAARDVADRQAVVVGLQKQHEMLTGFVQNSASQSDNVASDMRELNRMIADAEEAVRAAHGATKANAAAI